MYTNQAGGFSEDAARFMLRVTLAILMLFHGVAKIFGGVGAITGMVAKAGFPPALGYFVYVGEVVAPLFMLLGIWTRPAAVVVALNMFVAILLVHRWEIFTLKPTGGWTLELQALLLVSALVVALIGAGRYSVGSGRWN